MKKTHLQDKIPSGHLLLLAVAISLCGFAYGAEANVEQSSMAFGGWTAKFLGIVDSENTVVLVKGSKISKFHVDGYVAACGSDLAGDYWYVIQGSQADESQRQRRVLTVHDSQGNTSLTRSGVYRAALSPKSAQIAIVYGVDSEGHEFESRGVSIVDLGTGLENKIACSGREIEWNTADGRLYIFSYAAFRERVFSFNPDTGNLESTNLRGVNFSPDAKYYLTPDGEGGPPIEVIETLTERTIRTFRADDKGPFETPSKWLGGNYLLLAIPFENTLRYEAMDIVTGERIPVSGAGVVSFDAAKREFTMVTKDGLKTEKAGASVATPESPANEGAKP